ncbi:tol-pal system protein YbgF [Thiovibrio sp. JS02]
MKKTMTNLALTLCLSPLLMQCVAAQSDVRGMDLRLRTMDTKLTEMDRNFNALRNQRGTQAEMGNQLDQIKSRLLQLEGKLDEHTHQLRKLQDEQANLKQSGGGRIDQLQTQVNELSARNKELNTQLSSVSENFSQLQESRAREAAERAAVAAKAAEDAHRKAEEAGGPRIIEPSQTKKKAGEKEAGEAVRKEPEPKSAAAPAAEEKEPTSKDTLYNNGLAAYNAKKYKEAYNDFSSYLEKNPSGALAPNARFWLGECLFQQKEFELAILEYQKVIADYPKSNKAPAALLKQAQAFERLDEKETAKIVYNKLLADYPQSEQVAAAKKRLAELK